MIAMQIIQQTELSTSGESYVFNAMCANTARIRT